jgi:Holliday junction DNA helicase RuvA
VIGSLRGALLHRSTTGEVVIEVGGIGYRVIVAPRAMATMGEIGDPVFVWVHHHVREDGQTLYGFLGVDERAAFEALLGAHGVGPALAQAILSVHTPAELRLAVSQGDLEALCLVPGVGRKTAARLLIELKSRLDVAGLDVGVVAIEATGGVTGTASAVADVREALAGLGYGPDEIRDVLRELPASDDPAGMLRSALQALGARRA